MPTIRDPRVTRRDFLRLAAGGAVVVGAGGLLAARPWRWFATRTPAAEPRSAALAALLETAPEARHWASTATKDLACSTCHAAHEVAHLGRVAGGAAAYDHGKPLVQCLLCPRRCALEEGERGDCGARLNDGGVLKSLVYGRPVAIHIDPIEKKPFYHFLPGAAAFSLATAGCPLRCQFCQNWEISQSRPEEHEGDFVPPERIVEAAASRGAPVIAFTYNEPTVFIEYLADVARAARPRGIRSVIVSCGFMEEAPLAEMCEVLDAIKIDLKGLSEAFYRKVSGADLAPVQRSIRQAARSGRHLEIVNLVVPTLNDDDAMLRDLARWLHDEAGPDVPLHFTRFHPDYKLVNLPPTPVATLERARAMALDVGLRYVYVGNVPGHAGNHTYCPSCGAVVVRREGFLIAEMNVKGGACGACGARIAGVWA